MKGAHMLETSIVGWTTTLCMFRFIFIHDMAWFRER
jgi:hypothetical protein